MGPTPSDPQGSPSQPGERLESWKEIAGYLKRYVRTVQRWEKHEGLPVHRLMHSKRGTVYAYKAELDAWWNSRGATLENQQEPADESEPLELSEDETPVAEESPAHLNALRAVLALVVVGGALILGWLFLIGPKANTQSAALAPSRLLATIYGSSPGAAAGSRVLAADINGDGIADVVVSSEGSNEAGILFGGPGLARGTVKLGSTADILVREEHGHFLRLLGAADINGDHMMDLIWVNLLPEPENFTATGVITVTFGRRQWNSPVNLPSQADLRLSIAVPYDAGPHRAAIAGNPDLNGDGIDDLILAMPEFCPLGRTGAGAVFVFWGRRHWPAKLEVPAQADLSIWGAQKGEGLAEVGVGDINGDGKKDLVVAAGDGTLWGLRQKKGQIYVFLGRSSFLRTLDAAKDFDLLIAGSQPRSQCYRLSLGDVNGDGIQDILVGCPGDGQSPKGQVLVYYGRPKWQREIQMAQADWVLRETSLSDHFGLFVTAADLNRDGAADLLVCTPSSSRHQLLVFYGGPARGGVTLGDTADLVFRSREAKDSSCTGIPAVADFDGDQIPEILIGAPQTTAEGMTGAGAAHVFAPYLPIRIDIRPGNYPNPVWPGSQRVLSVAVFPRDGFDPTTLDTPTLRLAGVPPSSSGPCGFQMDGIRPLCVFFDSKDLCIKPTDRLAALTARTKDGTAVYGTDSVLVLHEPPSSH